MAFVVFFILYISRYGISAYIYIFWYHLHITHIPLLFSFWSQLANTLIIKFLSCAVVADKFATGLREGLYV